MAGMEEGVIGHYAGHTPWLPHIRVITRKGQLLLVPWWGEEMVLVPVTDTRFRIGVTGHPSEDIVFDGYSGGQAQRASMDGCEYVRWFTP
jgi:hypothetical protein